MAQPFVRGSLARTSLLTAFFLTLGAVIPATSTAANAAPTRPPQNSGNCTPKSAPSAVQTSRWRRGRRPVARPGSRRGSVCG